MCGAYVCLTYKSRCPLPSGFLHAPSPALRREACVRPTPPNSSPPPVAGVQKPMAKDSTAARSQAGVVSVMRAEIDAATSSSVDVQEAQWRAGANRQAQPEAAVHSSSSRRPRV